MKMNFCRVMRLMAQRYGQQEAIVNVERQRRYSYRQYHLLSNVIKAVMLGGILTIIFVFGSYIYE